MDALLGGSHHRPRERAFATQLRHRTPWWAHDLRTARTFACEALPALLDAGLDQVIDLSGVLPTGNAPHRILDQARTGRLVHVASDDASAHTARALLAGTRHTVVRHPADDPASIWRSVLKTTALDPDRPVVLLAVATTLERWDTHAAAAGALAMWSSRLPEGSVLVFTHATDDLLTRRDAEAAHTGRLMHHRLGVSLTARPLGAITDIPHAGCWRLSAPMTFPAPDTDHHDQTMLPVRPRLLLGVAGQDPPAPLRRDPARRRALPVRPHRGSTRSALR